jgi:hypothetical protein
MVTTWGPRIFEPAYSEWKAALGEVAPEWVSDFNPWDRITTPEAVRKLMEDGLARSGGEAGNDGGAGRDGMAEGDGGTGRNGMAEGDGGTGSDGGTGKEVRIGEEAMQQPLETVEDFWRVALGSGLRWPIEQMGPERAMLLKEKLLRRLTERANGPLKAIETNVIYALAVKAGL